MAEDDIYGSRRAYERFLANLERPDRNGKYPCRNPANLVCFRRLAETFEAKDISYVRRLRLCRSFQIATHFIEEDLADVRDRAVIDALVRAVRRLDLSTRTQADFITDLKHAWKLLFPDQDALGRPDETVTPYLVRHLSGKVDKSRERRRGDRLTLEEFERLLASFGQDVRLQAYLTLALESLARPQELLYLRLKDVELHDDYAVIYVSQHGKEGTKLLRCIDSYPYVAAWYNTHPRRDSPDAFFFCNLGHANRYGQMHVVNVNKHIKDHCHLVGIQKPVTSYSLKRNGVTIRVLRGDSPLDIQKIAGWTSAKQLRTYDQSDQLDAYKRELMQRGLIEADKTMRDLQTTKQCVICGATNGYAAAICRQCKRPLDRKALLARDQKEIAELTEHLVEAKVAAYMARYGVAPLPAEALHPPARGGSPTR